MGKSVKVYVCVICCGQMMESHRYIKGIFSTLEKANEFKQEFYNKTYIHEEDSDLSYWMKIDEYEVK